MEGKSQEILELNINLECHSQDESITEKNKSEDQTISPIQSNSELEVKATDKQVVSGLEQAIIRKCSLSFKETHSNNLQREAHPEDSGLTDGIEINLSNMSNTDNTVMEVGQFGITLNKDYKDYDSEDKGKIRNLINIPRHKSFYNQVFQIQQIIEVGESATHISSPGKIW